MSLEQLSHAWQVFFHEPCSTAPLVLFRILVGVVLLMNGLLLAPLIDDYYAADGLWPAAIWRQQSERRSLCLLRWLPDSTGLFRWFLAMHLLACVCFLVGFQFRLSAMVVFVTLVSIHHRNASILSSGDSLLRLLVFFCCFSDAAGGLSVDHWLGGHAMTEFHQTDPWALRLMQIQVSIVYLRTVYWKLCGASWRNGTAAWYPLWVDAYVRFRPPRVLLKPALIRLATWGTLVEELLLGAGLWVTELRYPLLITGVLLHVLFDVVLNLQLFSWIMVCSLLLFIWPQDSEWLLRQGWSWISG